MLRSDYTYELKEHSGHKVLTIEDLDLGGLTVTNNIENVVKEIEAAEKIDCRDYVIIYKDSDGDWDGWNPYTKAFLPLLSETWAQAMDMWIAGQFNYHRQS